MFQSRYRLIRIVEEDIPNTTFRMHYGHFEFLVMSFGLTNTPITFRKEINDTSLDQLIPFVAVFLNDIIIYRYLFISSYKHGETYISMPKC